MKIVLKRKVVSLSFFIISYHYNKWTHTHYYMHTYTKRCTHRKKIFFKGATLVHSDVIFSSHKIYLSVTVKKNMASCIMEQFTQWPLHYYGVVVMKSKLKSVSLALFAIFLACWRVAVNLRKKSTACKKKSTHNICLFFCLVCINGRPWLARH